MARLTVQEKIDAALAEADKNFMILLEEQLKVQSIELRMTFADEKQKARHESFERGWGQGHERAVKEFAQLSWLDRLFWRAER